MDRLTLNEQVCAKCPGTEWGATSKCKIKGISIGQVKSCPSWDSYFADEDGVPDGQLALIDMEPAMEAIQFAEEAIRDYSWKVKMIETIRQQLADAGEGTTGSLEMNANIRAQNKNSDKTGGEVVRREREWKRLERFEKQIDQFNQARAAITNEQEVFILDHLLDGWKIADIAYSLGKPRSTTQEMKNGMVRKLALALRDAEQG